MKSILILIVILIVLALFSLSLGQYDLSIKEIIDFFYV